MLRLLAIIKTAAELLSSMEAPLVRAGIALLGMVAFVVFFIIDLLRLVGLLFH
jgi:hypothetical protein